MIAGVETSRGFMSCLGWILMIQLTGCVSARMSNQDPDQQFKKRNYAEAIKKLEEGRKEEGDGRDELLYLLDLGLVYHTVGNYKESTKNLLEADKIADIKDYTDLAKETQSLLTSENMVQYKGEDFEKVLINTYLSINFAMTGEKDDAIVEAKRVNRKLQLMVEQGKKKYKQNAFARYLSGLLYESEGEYDDAYLDYKHAYDLMPDYPGIGEDLWRTSWLAKHRDNQEKWRAKFKISKADQDRIKQDSLIGKKGQIVVIYENGISPEKRPNPDFVRLPKFYARKNPVSYADVKINGEVKGKTAVLHDIESTAISNLDEKYAGLVAKRLAGVVVKESAAYGVEKATDSPLLGFLTSMALHAMDAADLRSWNLLPKDLQMARFPVEPGEYKVQLAPKGAEALPERLVKVEAGKVVFINERYTP